MARFIGCQLLGTHGYPKLDDANKTISYRFLAEEAKSVVKIRQYFSAVLAPPTYRIGLQADDGGEPSGTFLGSADFTPSAGFNVITLGTAVTLTLGSIYHVAIEYVSGTIGGSNYAQYVRLASNSSVMPYPRFRYDPNLNYLLSTDGGSSWTVQNADLGGCILEFSDGTYFGNTYRNQTTTTVFGINYKGEKVVLSKDVWVSAVDVHVYVGAGSPPNLVVVLDDVTGGVTLETVEISGITVAAWYTATFSQSRKLLAGNTYRLYLKCKGDGGDASNYYRCRGCWTTNSSPYNTLTWEGTDSCFTDSADGGSSWTDTDQEDMPLRFHIPTGGLSTTFAG